MIAMPFILVDIVLSKISLIFFCITSAALLCGYPWANLWLPAKLRNRKALAFVAHGLVLSVISVVAVHVVARLWHLPTFSPSIYDWFFSIGLMISVVLAYQFMDKRYFPNTPRLPRRLLIGILSLVMTAGPVFVAVTAVVGLS
jgi:hypothetical protein